MIFKKSCLKHNVIIPAGMFLLGAEQSWVGDGMMQIPLSVWLFSGFLFHCVAYV